MTEAFWQYRGPSQWTRNSINWQRISAKRSTMEWPCIKGDQEERWCLHLQRPHKQSLLPSIQSVHYKSAHFSDGKIIYRDYERIYTFASSTERTHLGSYVDRIPSSGNTRPQSCQRYALPPTTLPVAKPFFPPPPQSSPFGTLVANPVTSSGVYMKKHAVEVKIDVSFLNLFGIR